ncbi:DNA-binding transcriptional MerR regulator [Pseudomonas lini]|jgi:DNA-binding transcriptional MerR regulator|nr:DNA-binding transcriptional MerR regulator [Pseudomonas lini]
MKIGELEARSGASRHTLRYYEQIGLISPLRQTNNYRVYTVQTLQDLDFIQRAQSMGFSLGEIGEILDAQRNKLIDCADGAKLIEKKMAEIKQKIANFQSIYRYLDEERANLEASAARQLETGSLASSRNDHVPMDNLPIKEECAASMRLRRP